MSHNRRLLDNKLCNMFATSSALTSLTAAGADSGTMIVAGLSIAIAGGVALLGLGFGWRHLKKYVTGRKF